MSMNQMVHKLKNPIAKNGEEMKMLKKNGMKNGEKYIEMTKRKNGAINGRLI